VRTVSHLNARLANLCEFWQKSVNFARPLKAFCLRRGQQTERYASDDFRIDIGQASRTGGEYAMGMRISAGRETAR